MSWKATAYVKDLQVSPDGKKITRTEKLIMFVLADCYNEDYHRAWPSVQRLATASLTSERHARRILRALEGKGLVQVVTGCGSSNTNTYRFPGYSPDVTKEKPDRMSGLSGSNTRQTHHHTRTPAHQKPDTAMSPKPKEAETPNVNYDLQGSEFYTRELNEMRRHDPIGKVTRSLYQTQLENPTTRANLPEWFQRDAETLLKNYEEISLEDSSGRPQRDK